MTTPPLLAANFTVLFSRGKAVEHQLFSYKVPYIGLFIIKAVIKQPV
ncbi:MAG: hypothetical protein ACI8SK_000915 [Shewanella sp.]|jgi:hypothetical protein